MERKLVLESCLASGTWGLVEMFILLTVDTVEIDVPLEMTQYTSTLRNQMIPATDIKLKYKKHQDLFLSLLIAKCPVSICISNKHSVIRNMPTLSTVLIISQICQHN